MSSQTAPVSEAPARKDYCYSMEKWCYQEWFQILYEIRNWQNLSVCQISLRRWPRYSQLRRKLCRVSKSLRSFTVFHSLRSICDTSTLWWVWSQTRLQKNSHECQECGMHNCEMGWSVWIRFTRVELSSLMEKVGFSKTATINMWVTVLPTPRMF